MIKFVLTTLSLFAIAFCIFTFARCDGALGPPSDCPSEVSLQCSSAASVTWSEHVPFVEAGTISIYPFTFHADGKRYQSKGDQLLSEGPGTGCCEALMNIDWFPATPTLKWKKIPNDLIACAIFKAYPKVTSQNVIDNTSQIVWIWHNGLSDPVVEGDSMEVSFDKGRVLEGREVSEKTVVALDSNRVYYWMVWGWSPDHSYISHASRAIPFIVNPKPTHKKLEHEGEMLGAWNLVKAINLTASSVETQTFKPDLLDLSSEVIIQSDTCYKTNFSDGGQWRVESNQLVVGSLIFYNAEIDCNKFSALVEKDGAVIAVEFRRF